MSPLFHCETPFTASYDADNRMLSYNGHALSYDANGNLIQRETESGQVTYTWNSRNQLIAINGPNGNAEFEYDHLGRRISKTINGNTTQYLYHGMQAIAELQDSAIGAVYHTGLMIDEVLARYAGSGERMLVTDALGSVIALADEDGEIKTRYGYSAFGESESSGEESDNPLAYTGREDDGTGLYYYRARYYDPGLKRFVSSDPIGLAGGLNTYAYVFGDPVYLTDPFGLSAFGGHSASALQAMGAVQSANAVVAQAQAAIAPAQRQVAANGLSATFGVMALAIPATAPVAAPMSAAFSYAAIADRYQSSGSFDATSFVITSASLVPGAVLVRMGVSDDIARTIVLGVGSLDATNSILGARLAYENVLHCE